MLIEGVYHSLQVAGSLSLLTVQSIPGVTLSLNDIRPVTFCHRAEFDVFAFVPAQMRKCQTQPDLVVVNLIQHTYIYKKWH